MKLLKVIKTQHVATAILFSLIAIAYSIQMTELDFRSILVPAICIAIVVMCGLTVLFQNQNEAHSITISQKEIVTIFATIIYVFIIVLFGFYVASFCYAAFIYLHITGWTFKLSVVGFLYSTGISMLVYFLFEILLDYFTPEGIFFTI